MDDYPTSLSLYIYIYISREHAGGRIDPGNYRVGYLLRSLISEVINRIGLRVCDVKKLLGQVKDVFG